MSKKTTDQNQADYSLKDLRNQGLSPKQGTSGSALSARERKKRSRGAASDVADETKSLLTALLDDVSSEAEEELARIEQERQEKEAREKAQAEHEERLKREEIDRRLKEEEERQARMEESRRQTQRELNLRRQGDTPDGIAGAEGSGNGVDSAALALAGFEGAMPASGAAALAARPQTITIKQTAWGLTALLMILPIAGCAILAYFLVSANTRNDESMTRITAATTTEIQLREQISTTNDRLAELEKINADLKKSLEEQQALVQEERAARQKTVEQQRTAKPSAPARTRSSSTASNSRDDQSDVPSKPSRVDNAPKIDLGSPAKTGKGGLIF